MLPSAPNVTSACSRNGTSWSNVDSVPSKSDVTLTVRCAVAGEAGIAQVPSCAPGTSEISGGCTMLQAGVEETRLVIVSPNEHPVGNRTVWVAHAVSCASTIFEVAAMKVLSARGEPGA